MAGLDDQALAVVAQAKPHGFPGAGQVRVQAERPARWSQSKEPGGQGLPHATHGGQVQATGGVPVRSSRSRRQASRNGSSARSGSPARASRAAWTAGDRELPWAVRGPGAPLQKRGTVSGITTPPPGGGIYQPGL